MSKNTEEQCDNLIYLYWRIMLQVPESTPRIALVAETATMRTKWRVWQEKLLLVKRLQRQKTTSLARLVYEEQVKLGWPGLAEEASKICVTIGLPDINMCKVKKEDIHNAIFFNHLKDLKDNLKDSKKLEKIVHQDYCKEQEYLHGKSLDCIRTQFRIRTEMLESFKDNYRSKNRTLDRGEEDDDPGLQCQYCDLTEPARDSQAHCLQCPAWGHLRQDLDLTFMEDMVSYFRRVMEARADLEEEERKRRRKEREEKEKRRKEQARPNKRRGRD